MLSITNGTAFILLARASKKRLLKNSQYIIRIKMKMLVIFAHTYLYGNFDFQLVWPRASKQINGLNVHLMQTKTVPLMLLRLSDDIQA